MDSICFFVGATHSKSYLKHGRKEVRAEDRGGDVGNGGGVLLDDVVEPPEDVGHGHAAEGAREDAADEGHLHERERL